MNDERIIITGPGKYVDNKGNAIRVRLTDWPDPFGATCIGHIVGCSGVRKYWLNGMDTDSSRGENITGPWIDKPVIDWDAMSAWAIAVARNASGQWFEMVKVPKMVPYGWEETGGFLVIPDAYAPKWEGDWRDSLVIRPGYEVGK